MHCRSLIDRPPAAPRCRRSLRLVVAVFAALAAGPPAVPGTPPPGFVEIQVVTADSVGGAAQPTAIAYEPGSGNLWVTEKGSDVVEGTARVRVRDAVSGTVSTALTLDCVDSTGERGILGIAFSPDFLDPAGNDRHVYLYYTRRIADAGTCSITNQPVGTRFRVSRFTESAMALSGEEIILEGPYLNAATNHNAGALRFAPDKTLFIATGDNDTDGTANPLSRDLGDLRGKLLRVNADGSIPADNPFVGQPNAAPEIWAYGLRNPFRFTIDEATGAPIIADVGERTWEAVYLGIAGADYGYPCVEGSAPFRNCNPPPPPGTFTEPIFEYGHGDQTPPVSGNSITGGPVYRGTAFPEEYRGNYYFGDYVDDWIRRGRLTEAGRLEDVEMFVTNAFGVVDLAVSPAGCLAWVGVTGAGVREVCHVGGGNGQPRAVSSATPSAGLANLQVQFAGSGSSDPDLDPLLYSWDFGDGGSSALADPVHLYSADGIYETVLTVDDQRGEITSVDDAPPLRIVVGNRPPAVTIASPAPGTLYQAGEAISFSGGASDPEDGALGAARLSWTVVFHHGGHTHPFLGPIAGVSSGDLTIPAAGEDATDVFYRIHLAATDLGSPLGSDGELSTSTFVDLLPRVSVVALAAHPAGFGLELEYDRQPMEAPFARQSVAGFPRTIGAASPQTTGGRTFFFQSWSDSGAREHGITTPVQDTLYTATFATSCVAPGNLELSNELVAGVETYERCGTITVGPSYEILAGGDVTAIAGERVVLGNGFSVQVGGSFTALQLPMI